MSMEESISLEETNKIRISLGLKPLTDDKAPADDKDKQAQDNYAKQRQRETNERNNQMAVDRIAKVRNRRELNTSLKGATLGDADADTDDTLKWIKRSKKKQKELAKKRLEELNNMDEMFQAEYTERDLEGLKVGHDFAAMDQGDARILTLKDSRILDDEEDELQNVEMAEDERTKRNNDLKIKKKDYTGYDDDEFEEGRVGQKRSVLAKYDEELQGPQDTGFRLGSSNIAAAQVEAAQKQAEREHGAAHINTALLSIDYIKNVVAGDYVKEGDVGFKKSKKKKRPSRRVPGPEPDNDDTMEVDEKPVMIPVDPSANFVDDDELQAALARTRRAKLAKNKAHPTEEDLAQRIAAEREAEATAAKVKLEAKEEEGRLTFDDTSEFIRAIGNVSEPIKKEQVPAAIKQQSEPRDVPIPSADVPMKDGDIKMEELEAGEVVVKDEEDEEDEMAILDALEAGFREEEEELKNGILDDDGVGGTSSQQTFKSGMASTLNILRQQGILSAPSNDSREREAIQLQRDRWMADQRRKVAQRELAKLQSRGGAKDQQTREHENRLREQADARMDLESFKNYKPDVNIKYYDEFGRALTPKEAWKALSHKFHGKGSGKMKTEKRLKKIAEEKKQEAMVSGDTPLSMNKAFQIRQQKTGQAHFVLSVGNKGAIPQASEFLDAQPLSKTKTERAKKKKDGKNGTPAPAENGFMTLPAPQLHLNANRDSPIPSGSGFASGTASPAMKPGFSRISSIVESTSQGGTPVPAERSKVAFGFGMKRKATEDAQGSPSAKRR